MALLNQTPQAYYNGNDLGNYQFVSLSDIINQFMLIYVGEDKIISKAKRLDVVFHAQRALAELSFDTLKSFKSQEISIPPSLQMKLPQDYVNYTNVFSVDSAGIKHPIYPTKHTQNPVEAPLQDDDGEFILQAVGTLVTSSNSVVLDKEYKNIIVGMKVYGPYIPASAGILVKSTSNLSSITTIELMLPSGSDFNLAQDLANATLNFENSGEFLGDGTLISPQNSCHIVENLSFSGSIGNQITASSASDIADLKVGMLISNVDFTPGTTIIDIAGTTIITSQFSNSTTAVTTGEVTFVDPDKDTKTWSRYKTHFPTENNRHDYDYDDEIYNSNIGGRYGLEPSHAQINGSFYIDDVRGLIHFSSNLSTETIVLDYISDSLGTEDEMQVHKFAEEAMYKWLVYTIASGRVNTPEYIVQRLRKEKFAAVRTAKLRLSNLKLQELTQVLRGKSKWIKH
tara:strand:- start:4749 stop:6113 length:1365 start_codon:yes stop_codon:yes gene_type:complete